MAMPTVKNLITTWCSNLASPSVMLAAKTQNKTQERRSEISFFLIIQLKPKKKKKNRE